MHLAVPIRVFAVGCNGVDGIEDKQDMELFPTVGFNPSGPLKRGQTKFHGDFAGVAIDFNHLLVIIHGFDFFTAGHFQ